MRLRSSAGIALPLVFTKLTARAIQPPNARSAKLVGLLSELCGSQDDFEQMIAESFDALEACLGEMNNQGAQLAQQRSQLDQQRAHESDDRQELLESLQSELTQLRSQTSKSSQRDAERIEQLTLQCESLEVEASSADATRLEHELQAARTALAESEAELVALRVQLATAHEGDQGSPEAVELASQCDVLEQELESVRVRASELAESLEQTQRATEQQRGEWEQERKQLQAQLDARSLESSGAHVAAEAPVAAAPPQATGGVDPNQVVVGSVMAQFEQLRSQRAKRRNTK